MHTVTTSNNRGHYQFLQGLVPTFPICTKYVYVSPQQSGRDTKLVHFCTAHCLHAHGLHPVFVSSQPPNGRTPSARVRVLGGQACVQPSSHKQLGTSAGSSSTKDHHGYLSDMIHGHCQYLPILKVEGDPSTHVSWMYQAAALHCFLYNLLLRFLAVLLPAPFFDALPVHGPTKSKDLLIDLLINLLLALAKLAIYLAGRRLCLRWPPVTVKLSARPSSAHISEQSFTGHHLLAPWTHLRTSRHWPVCPTCTVIINLWPSLPFLGFFYLSQAIDCCIF